MDKGSRKRVLSPGYRFEPHDHELLKFYLLPKVKDSFVYPSIIHDMDAYSCQPSQLPSALEDEAKYSYFFTPREQKFDKGSRPNRCTKDGKGYWRMTSSINEIFDIDESPLGRKSTLVYFQKTKPEKGIGIKTNWIMHEFTLDERLLPLSDGASLDKKANHIVLCRIYENRENKKRRKNETKEDECIEQGQFYGDSTLEHSNSGNEKALIVLPVHESICNNNLVASASEFNWSSGESMPTFTKEEVDFLLSCFLNNNGQMPLHSNIN